MLQILKTKNINDIIQNEMNYERMSYMGNIVLLDELTINKIAAGEVIERPASVVKEMVENSIDAGAKHITIEIKNGGISFIRITDDGKGIAKDDVELAFERHATSKIRSADDLNTVKSMGFRGEALASIAAIANVELVSKQENDEIGTRIVVEGGNALSLDEIGASKGTTITVRNLFFNTPVRYKFLKKDFTESGYIEDVVTRLSLIHPDVSIKFVNSGKVVVNTNGSGKITDVIYSIYGKEIASNIINVDYEYEYIKIKGVIGKPNIARSNRANQIFFVNERYIKDKTLSSAVEQGVKGLLPIGKFAFLVLNLEMPSSKVDVNVHPAKLEVRFSEESTVFKAMYHAIKDAFLKAGFMSDRERTEAIKEASKDAFKIQNIEDNVKQVFSINNEKQDINKTEIKPNSILKNPTVVSNEDVFQKLKNLQEDLKKEVEQNPNLHLTDKYKQMEEQFNTIITPIKKQEEIEEELEKKEYTVDPMDTETKNIEQNNVEDINNITVQNEEDGINNIEEQNKEETIKSEVENKEDYANIENKEVQEENVLPLQEYDNVENKEKQKEIISFEQMYKELFGKEPYGGRKQEEVETKKEDKFYEFDNNLEESNVSMFETQEDYQLLKYKFIGIAFNTYIILEIQNEIYIMDQHAAHERILYEKVKKNFLQGGEKASQMLLLPDIINLSHKEMDIAKDNFELFRKAGFILEEFGENTIKLSGVPEICINLDTAELFRETLDEINQVARTAKQEKEERFLATVACKAAVKANMKLTKEEVDNLMEELLKLPNPFTCPHGRPTVIRMSKYEIERKFARK